MADRPVRNLPQRPSKEHLRKQAKREARSDAVPLWQAQRDLAMSYGARNWAELMRRVDQSVGAPVHRQSGLAAAARVSDFKLVERLLQEGHPADGDPSDAFSPLWYACSGAADVQARVGTARLLLAHGANARRGSPRSTPLHAAAEHGPLELVEALLEHGAVEWEEDGDGRTPLTAAKSGRAREREAIVELLDRPVVRDQTFRRAIAAIQRGDIETLGSLLDAEPRLLHERIEEPECYRRSGRPQYFLNPALFWFIANNPRLADAMPPNTIAVAEVMIARGVAQADLNYALELVMSSASAREHGVQERLIKMFTAAGALTSERALDAALAHGELAAVRALPRDGDEPPLQLLAATGRLEELEWAIARASGDRIQHAFSMAVVNCSIEAARLLLQRGADANAHLTVHAHSYALHQAAIHDNEELLKVLIGSGADPHARDEMWNATARDWAVHEGKSRAAAYLASIEAVGRNGASDNADADGG